MTLVKQKQDVNSAATVERSYRLARSAKRQRTRERIHAHVLHPIDTPALLRDPLFHPSSRIDSTITSLKLLATAVAVHGFIILLFSAVNDLVGEKAGYQPSERVTIEVVETPPPVVEPEPEEALGPLPDDFAKPVEPEPVKVEEPEEAPPPKPKKRIKDEPPPDKQESSQEPPDQAPPARRVVGIDYESTVSDGKGPSLGTGTTRMGQSSTTAQDPKEAAKQTNGTSDKPGTGKGDEVRQQRTASHIPTRDIVFVKPKRSKPSKPPYPETLKARGLEGDVEVRVSIDAKGRVTEVAILKSSGEAAFDEAARVAAQGESFQPATRDGQPVAFTLSYSYRFRIEEN